MHNRSKSAHDRQTRAARGRAESLYSSRVHELSIALGLLDDVAEAARAEGAERVCSVHVRIGALAGVVPEALRFSWDVACADSIAAGSELRVEEIPLVLFCEHCEQDVWPPPFTGFICPKCGGSAPRIVHGRELEIVGMEVPA